MKQHFVTFFSPGSFVAEDITKPIKSWNVAIARRMALQIKERHGATPYGFQFTTRSRGAKDLDSRVSAKSPVYYINCKIETLEEITARNDPRDDTLLHNMRINHYERIVTTTKGWRWSQPLNEKDVVLP